MLKSTKKPKQILPYWQNFRKFESRMSNKVTKHIPNFITCCNLFSGCMAVLAAFAGDTTSTLMWVVIGAVCDFLDGFAARLLKAYSPVGLQLDSLADLITFGLAPSLLCYSILGRCNYNTESSVLLYGIPLLGFLIVVFSAIRLAKFNTDTRQTNSFIGLPVPANALFWCGLFYGDITLLEENPWITIILVVIFSFLMISEIPMFSLKFKSLGWSENKIRFIFLIVSVAILIWLGISGIPAVIGWYIILSLLTKGQS